MTKELIDKHDTKNFMKYWEKVYSEVEGNTNDIIYICLYVSLHILSVCFSYLVKRGGKTSTSEEVDVIESEIEDENNLEHAVLDKDLTVQEFVVEVETEVETNLDHVLHKDLTQQEYVVEDVDVTYGDSILESWLSSVSDTTAPPAAISSATVTPTSPATSRVQNPPYQLANNTETLIVLNGPDPMIQSTIPKTVITEVLSPSVESSVATSSRPVNVIETVPLPSSDLVLAKPTLPDTVAVFTTVNLPTSSLIHQASHQAASVEAQLPVCSVSTNTLLSAAMNQSTMPVCSVSENTLLSATMGQSKSNQITSTEILLPPVSSSVSTSSRPVNVIETVPMPSSDLVLANPTLPDTVDAVTTVNLPTSSLIQQATHETASVEAQLLVCSVSPNTPISEAMNQSTMPVCSVSGNTPLSAAMIQSKTHQTVITEFLLPSVASSVTASSRSDTVKVLATVNLPLSSTIYVKSSLPPKRSIPLAISEDTRKSKRSRKEKSFSDDKQSHSDSSSRQKERCGAQDCRKVYCYGC